MDVGEWKLARERWPAGPGDHDFHNAADGGFVNPFLSSSRGVGGNRASDLGEKNAVINTLNIRTQLYFSYCSARYSTSLPYL